MCSTPKMGCSELSGTVSRSSSGVSLVSPMEALQSRAEAAKTFSPMAMSTWVGIVNGDKISDAGGPSPALATSFLLA